MIDEAKTAKNWIDFLNPIYLDTETTGLHDKAEAVQIAIIDDEGKVLLDTLIRPVRPIPIEATRIHGIGQAEVATAPLWAEVWPKVAEIVRNRAIIIYNKAYDCKIIQQSGIALGIRSELSWHACKCAMLLYADYYGEWDEYHGNNRWQRLENACHQQSIDTSDIAAHSAAGDCEMTRRLIHSMANVSERMVLP